MTERTIQASIVSNAITATILGGVASVTSVNGETGVVTLDADDIGDGTTYAIITKTQEAAIATNTSDIATNVTVIGLNTTHRGSDGSDHSYINQDVTNGAAPVLDATNFTNIPSDGGFGYPSLSGFKYVRISGGNLQIGDNDLYIVPEGKKCLIGIGRGIAYNTSGGTVVIFGQMKISSTYYRMTSNNSVTAGNTNGLTFQSFVLNAGESYSVNADATGLNYFLSGIEFDDTETELKTYYDLSLTSGNQTLYTVPAGKNAIGTYNLFNTNTHVAVVNDSGGSINYYIHNVPSGDSADSTNQVGPTSAAADNTIKTLNIESGLDSGDFIVVNSSSANAGQIAWVTVYERAN